MTSSPSEREQLEQAITAQEAMRATLGDAIVDATLAALREKLAALDTAGIEEERKLVTVLFADVAGFTALSEAMDPEDVQTLMRGYFARWIAILEKHGGRVEKFIGDAVMAVFGYESARENDSEQAIRSALELRQALAEYNQELEEKYNRRVQIRVGINTGMVLEGRLGPDGKLQESMLVGDTVNTASRLEHAAPLDGILISHETYQHVRGVFDVQEQPPLDVRGKSSTMQVYAVLQAKPRSFRQYTRGVEGVETRMVGREAEFKQLKDAFEWSLTETCPQLVTVVGDPGMGKSRLLYEFSNWVELRPESVWTFRGRASLQIQSGAFALLRDMFNDRFEIFDNDPLPVARSKFVQGMAAFHHADVEEMAHFIGYLVGLDFSDSPFIQNLLADAAQIRDRALRYIVEFFNAVGSTGPVVLYLEDVHWADDGSLDLLMRLARDCPHIPLMILCMARPTLYEHRPQWGSGESFTTRVDLRPLSRVDSRILVDEILRRMVEVPSALREMLTANSEGNPFYLEELIKMLIEDRVILSDGEHWQVDPDRLVRFRIPSTLIGILQARLDSLPREEKHLLQRASVVGQVFWDKLVIHLSGNGGQEDPAGPKSLAGLSRREMIYLRETSAFVGTQEYTFKHTILHEITYETVLKKQRKEYHRHAAEWLVTQSGERLDEYAGLIAAHYLAAEEPSRAADYLARAGEEAMKRGLYGEAAPLFRRALEACAGSERVRLLLKLGEATCQQGDLPSARPALEQALELAGEDVRAQAEVHRLLGQLDTSNGDYIAALDHLQLSLSLARQGVDQRLLARVLLGLAETHYRQGDIQAARLAVEEAIRITEAIQDQGLLCASYYRLGTVCKAEAEPLEAAVQIRKSLALARQIGDREGEMRALNGLGYLASLTNLEESAGYIEQALQVARQLNHLQAIWMFLGNLAECYLEQEKLEQAAPLIQESLRIARQGQSQLWLLIVIATTGYYKLELGEVPGALRLLGLVLSHPAREADIIDQVNQKLEQKRESLALTDPEIESLLAGGKGLDPLQVADELLEEFATEGKAKAAK